MMLYHYINGKYGLENVLKRRVRISRLNELNDPFEFFAPDLSDRNFRTVFRKTKSEKHYRRFRVHDYQERGANRCSIC